MIPDYQSLKLPFLRIIADGQEYKFRDLVEFLAAEFKVTDEERNEFLPSNQAVFDYHVGCVRTHLKKAGLIDSPKQATFVITELGLQTLKKNPDHIDANYLSEAGRTSTIENDISDNKNSTKMTIKITRPASMVKQGDLTLYATSLKVSDLLIPNFYSIERLDPENASEKGYQRLLNKARAKRLADYIVAGQETRDAFLPTSIFIATKKNILFNPSNNTIDIDIDEVAPFNVVDGQHRVEGLKMACEKDPRVMEFEVPVNIAINLPEIAQMCHFLIVNTTQKSVEEGVAQRIRARLTQALGVVEMPHLPKWILNSVQKGEDDKALQFVDFLNSEIESPWYNRIKMANEENSEGSITQKSFVKAIKKYFIVANNPIIATETEDKQLRIFLNYWKAITNIIGTDEPTVLFKYNGVELFCRFCVPFFNKMINMNDFKVATMQTLFEQVFENVEGDAVGVGHTDFWLKGSTASGLNAGALSKINNEMVKALHKSSEIKKGKEMEV
jgi:DGQHR domain-containing protein